MSRHLPACLMGSLLLSLALPAVAASLRTEVSARQVGVGERVVVRVTAVEGEDDERPRDPRLQVDGAAEVQGPSVATQASMRMHNFSVTQERSVVATWFVTPTAPGQLTIGPASFVVGSQQLRGETIVVRVNAASTQQQQRAPDPFDPFSFDPFSLRRGRATPPGQSFGLSEAPEQLKLEKAPHPVAFLRAVPSKRKVVVGEPLTLEIYAYGSRGQFREVSPTEPTTSDFLSFPVVEHSQEEPPYVTTIGDEQWFLVKLRQLILVPLRAGQLSIGGMEAFVQGPGYPTRGSRYGMKVSCAPLEIEVVEPPLAGRPPDYLLGDVGRLTLETELSSRKLIQGDYLQLVVRVKGSGNLPSRVRLPSLAGVEWQEPALEGGPRVRDGKLGGTRTIKVAARVNQPGVFELGEVTLPFYDAAAREYRVAKATLGAIEVTPRATSPSSASPSAPPDPGRGPALAPRHQLRDLAAPAAPWLRPWHWLALFAAPALAALGRLGAWLWVSLRTRAAASPTPRHTLRRALVAARKSAGANDLPTTLRELERALYDAIEQATGVRARGVLRAHLEGALRDAGLDATLARDVGSTLVEWEALRYDPGDRAPSALVDDASVLLKKLQRTRLQRASATPLWRERRQS